MGILGLGGFAKTPYLGKLKDGVFITPPPPPILWSKLESTSIFTSIEIGPAFEWDTYETKVFAAAQFGNGIDMRSISQYRFIGIPGSFFTSDLVTTGCMEFWWKPAFSKQNVLDNTYGQDRFLITDSLSDAGNNRLMSYIEYATGGQTGKIGIGVWNSTGAVYFDTPTWAANDLIHIGISWTDTTQSVYWNGSSLGTDTRTKIAGAKTNVHFGVRYNWFPKAIFDNVKIWDYAKTDFSDRLVEGV